MKIDRGVRESDQYNIRIFGHIGGKRIGLPEGTIITMHEDGSTEFLCSGCDQSMLNSILNRIMDLGLKLLEVKIMKRGDNNESN